LELLALLVDCQILFKVDAARDSGLRPAEGDDNLILWDSTICYSTRAARKADTPTPGGTYPYSQFARPDAALRKRSFCAKFGRAAGGNLASGRSSCARVTRRGASMIGGPITLAELSRFLDAPRVCRRDLAAGLTTAAVVAYAPEAVSLGGGSYELELYLAVDTSKAWQRGYVPPGGWRVGLPCCARGIADRGIPENEVVVAFGPAAAAVASGVDLE